MSDIIIELNNISIFHRKNLLMNDVSFKVERGEFVYLIGKTGSGKSSFMKTLYGDLPLIDGSAIVCIT